MSISNSMVAHKWAHGNDGKGSNFYATGKRLISYGTDVGFNTGRELVFLSANNMSPSTGKQLSYARRAVSHLGVVYTPIFRYGSRLYDFNENEAFKMACEALNIELEGYGKGKLSKYLHSRMLVALNEAGRLVAIAERYGFKQWVVSAIPADKLEAARAYAEQWGARDATRREAARVKAHARQAAQREHDADQFNRWHTGDTGARCPESYRYDADGGYYIAVRDDGKVVTSGGAECPIEHARRGIEFWRSRCHEAGAIFDAWHRNGHRVQLGNFQLDRIESDGTAYAGCHKFSVAELNRLVDILL